MVRHLLEYVLHKCDKKARAKHKHVDRISELPDDIIVGILSRLTLKEAIRSSILSRRWKYLWTFISTSLCFDSGKLLCDKAFKTKNFRRCLYDYEAKFIAWVNHVLKSHQSPRVDKFKVSFGLDSTYCNDLDSWVNFAVEKRVERFEMNLTDLNGFRNRDQYAFPCVDKLKLPWNYTRLTSLHLMTVNVSAESVHHFLRKCPFLEQLCIVRSNTTSSLKIDSLKLKCLDLYNCTPLENLEISAPNLVSFSYSGPQKEVPFKNVPLLCELCIGFEYCESFLLEAPKHSSYLSQLIRLTLIIPTTVTETWDPPSNLPVLCNLKQLELRVGVSYGYRLTWLTSLIKAAPTLSKFVVKLLFVGLPLPTSLFGGTKYSFEETPHGPCCMECSHHQSLKEMEFVGFVGFVGIENAFVLAVRLLEISTVLEKFTIDTRHPGFMWGPDLFCKTFADREADDSEGAKKIAHKLRSHVPQGAKFVIV